MEENKLNVRKIEALRKLKTGNYTSKQLSEELGISQENAQMLLYRLFKQGLVERRLIDSPLFRKPYEYNITLRGLEKLRFLEGLIK